MDPKARFNKVFTNLPIPERENAIYVDDKHGPLSWHVARLEINQDTETGTKILEFLVKTEII